MLGKRRFAEGGTATLLLSALVSCAQTSAATVSPSFGPAITVASSGVPRLSAPPSVAVDAAGSSVVAWSTRAGVVIRTMNVSGGLRPTQRLGVGSAPDASIAPDGEAAVIWQTTPRGAHGRRLLLAAIARPGKPFGRAQQLVSVNANVPDWSIVATDGRVVAVWSQNVSGRGPSSGSQVRYAVAAGAARFGSPRTLALAGNANLGGAVADANGDVTVSYQTPPVLEPGPVNAQVAAAVMPAASQEFAMPTVLSADTERSIPASEGGGDSVFAGPGGVAVGYSVQGTLPWLLRVSTVAPGLAFTAARTAGEVPNPPPSVTTYSGPVIALPAEGGAVAAWTVGREAPERPQSPATGSLEVAGEQASGSFSAPEQLSPPKTLSQYPVAAATIDSAIVAWGVGPFDRERLVYSVRLAGSSFTAPRTLGTGVLRNGALGAAGAHAVIVWIAGGRLLAAELTG